MCVLALHDTRAQYTRNQMLYTVLTIWQRKSTNENR